MYFPRVLDLPSLLAAKSHFLFGPRQTGKTTLIRETLKDAEVFDLLDRDFRAVSRDPSVIDEAITDRTKVVVIDEIQKMPSLLDKVHHLIETRNVHFLLTGSSARKLRRGGHNLLGGRAGVIRLHPLLLRELGDEFRLQRALQHGTLPSIYLSDTPRRDLEAYVMTYLRGEIAAEGLSRNLPSFSRLLDVAAECNASIVNFAGLSSELGIPRTTVVEHFEILQDTLLIYELPAWRKTKVRRATARSKYYFFDTGVAAAVLGRRGLNRGTSEYGFAFETWIMHELRGWTDYASNEPLHFWQSQSGFEVDFLIGDHTAIEVKAKEEIGNRDLRSLRAFMEEATFKRHLCVCLEPRPRRMGEILILPYRMFLENLWQHRYVA